MKKINWINSYKSNNKSEIYKVEIRIGTFTALELTINAARLRFMIFNLGFELEFQYIIIYYAC